MIEWFVGLNPVVQALIATCFTWFMTASGAGTDFIFKSNNRTLLDAMPGFVAGVMIYVVVEALIPESQVESNSDVSTTGLMLGFVVMMILDVALV
jgi:zinc transporter, ZIP family